MAVPVTAALLDAWLMMADAHASRMTLGAVNWVMMVRSLIAEVRRLEKDASRSTPDVNILLETCREVTRAYNALFWGRYLSAEAEHEAEQRLQNALEAVVRLARGEA